MSLQELVRQASLNRAKQLQWFEGHPKLVPLVEEDNIVLAHWLAFILLWGDAAKFVFSVHFSVASAKQIVGDDGAHGVLDDDIKDTMREFCNLTGGHIRNVFAEAGQPLGLSLPSLTSGFDQVWFRNFTGASSHGDAWSLANGEKRLICTSDIKILDPGKVNTVLEFVKSTEGRASEEGEVELL